MFLRRLQRSQNREYQLPDEPCQEKGLGAFALICRNSIPVHEYCISFVWADHLHLVHVCL
jgi:hypothetical protein